MGRRRLRLLIVDSDPVDIYFVTQAIAVARGQFTCEHAATLAQASQRLRGGGIDLVLLELNLPDSRSLETCSAILRLAPDTATVVFTSVDHKATAIEAVRRGAQDYLCKGRVSPESLVWSLYFAVERQKQRYGDGNGRPVRYPVNSVCRPYFDLTRREFRVGQQLVKRYRQPSPNQERILRAFQEEGWPVKIDDPLLPEHGIDPKERLRATIRSLNSHQSRRLIRFAADGTGRAIYWHSLQLHDYDVQPVDSPAVASQPARVSVNEPVNSATFHN